MIDNFRKQISSAQSIILGVPSITTDNAKEYLLSCSAPVGATSIYRVYLKQRASCIVELAGGYGYGDASLNSYYKYAINFRDNNKADFISLHKTVSDRLKLGYRWWGDNNQILTLIVYVNKNSNFVLSVKGNMGVYDTLSSAPSDTVWL